MTRFRLRSGPVRFLLALLSLAVACALTGRAAVAQQWMLRGTSSEALPDAPSFVQAAGAVSPQQAQAVAAQQGKAGEASISGQITDVNGGIVPGATVSVMDATGKPGRKAVADGEGRFALDELAAGTYKLKIDADGLQSFEPPPIVLKDAERYTLPITALPIATANQSVDVVLTRDEIAEEELRLEEKQRLLGFIPNFYTSYVWNAAPLSRKQKLRLSVRSITDPYVFARVGLQAGVQQVRGTYPEYGDDVGGYFTRFASDYGDALAGRLIGSALLPIVFHQDPRYFYRGTGGVKRRIVHALLASVVARSDKGGVVPNYTRTLGNFSAGYLSRVWHPDTDNGLSLAFENMFIGIGESAGRNLLQEFLYKRISTHTPPFAKGKPEAEKESAAHP